MKKSKQFNIEAAYLVEMAGFNCDEKAYELMEYVGDDHDVFTNQQYRNMYRDIKEYSLMNKIDYHGIMNLLIGKGYFANIKEYTDFVLNDNYSDLSYVSSQNLYILLKDNQVRRNLIIMHQKEIDSLSNNGDVFTSVDKTRDTLDTLIHKTTKSTLKSSMTLVELTNEYLIEKRNNPKKFDGLLTGYKSLDKILGGIAPTELVYLAARPSLGKTAIALNIALNMASAGKKVAFFSLEMSVKQIMLRILSILSGVDINQIKYGKHPQATIDVLDKSLSDFYNMSFYIDDTSGASLQHIKNRILMLPKEERPDIVFVDYLQLMTPPSAQIREQEVAKLSSGLKHLCKEFNINFVVLAQLNRALEARNDKRPMLSDLRESGSLEQDADKVLFLHRPEFYGIDTMDDGRPSKDIAEVIVAKNREGDTGSAKLIFQKTKTKFVD